MKFTWSARDRGFAELLKLQGTSGAARAGIIGGGARDGEPNRSGQNGVKRDEHGRFLKGSGSKWSSGGGGSITNVDLGIIHEFGTADGRIPERSFLRANFDDKVSRYEALHAKLTRAVYDRKLTVVQALQILGAQVALDTKAFIRAGISPPNTPATIAAKGSSTPLIDSSQLINAITYEVKMGRKA